MDAFLKILILQFLVEFLKIFANGDDPVVLVENQASSASFYGSTAFDNSSTTIPTPTVPAVTITPATKVKYSLNLTNPGPSVLDSTLSFVAELKTENGEDIPKDMNFSYLWMNMADMKAIKRVGHFQAKLPLSFPSNSTEAGDYTMTVVVSEESNPSKILAFQTRKFVLTKELNGHLELHQDLEYKRLSNTFATHKPIRASAIVVDHFEEQQKPFFKFFWYENGKYLITSEVPEVVTTIETAGNLSLKAEILATMAVRGVRPTKRVITILCMSIRCELQKEAEVLNEVKGGNFEEKIFFKDPLSNCFIERVDAKATDREVRIGGSALVNITCNGSAPTAVCMNISTYNASADPTSINYTCEPGQFVDSLHHQVQVKLNKTGWNDVHFFVYNDVTRKQYTVAYYAYDPDSENIPALVLPLVFVVLGCFVITTGIVYIMRLRKKPLVEVADFDFHPTLNESSSNGPSGMRLSLVANTIKYMIARRKWGGSQRQKLSSSSDRRSETEYSRSAQRSENGADFYEAL